MSPAVTPLFRLLCRPAADETGARFPSRIPGQCRAENRWLAVLTFGVVLTAALDLTSAVTWWSVRIPLLVAVCFLLPHFVMLAIAALPLGGVAPSVRQAWAFLAVVTLYAAARVLRQDAGAVSCAVWLVFGTLNLVALPFVRED